MLTFFKEDAPTETTLVTLDIAKGQMFESNNESRANSHIVLPIGNTLRERTTLPRENERVTRTPHRDRIPTRTNWQS